MVSDISGSLINSDLIDVERHSHLNGIIHAAEFE